jgi:hypothetical protein
MKVSQGEILDCVVMDLGQAEVRQRTRGNGSDEIALTLPRIGSTRIRLQLVSLFTPDAVVAELVNGEWVYSRPDPKTYVGWVDGDATASVQLTLVGSASMGSIRDRGETFRIEPAVKYSAGAGPAAVIIYSDRDFHGNGGIDLSNDSMKPPIVETPSQPGEPIYSNGTRTPVVAPSSMGSSNPVFPSHSTIPAKAYARAFLASDDEFRASFPDWQGYQQGLLQNIDDIYSNQLDVHFRIAGQFALATSDLAAPLLCSNTDTNNVLLKFRNRVENDPTIGPTAIPRDVSVLTSTRSFSDGIGCAYQSSLAGSYAYAVTAPQTNPIGNVMLHEIGHVFGGWHEDAPLRPANTGAHERGMFPSFWCAETWSYSIYSIMWHVLHPQCMEGGFSDGSVQADRNNKAYMLNNIVPRLRKIGQNLMPGSGSTFSSSGDLWGHTASLVGDGDLSTYWWATTKVSWLQIVLPATRYIQRFEIHGFSGYYLSSFSVKLSPDGSAWTTVFTGGSTSTVDFSIPFPAMWARYARLEVYDTYSSGLNEFAVIREIELFETVNVASWQPGTSSGNLWGHMPQEAVDGNLATYWWGTASSGSWIQYQFVRTCTKYLRLIMFEGYGVLGLRVYSSWRFGEASTDYWWVSPQNDLLLPTQSVSCATGTIKLTFLSNANGFWNNYPVVREIEVYYGE